MELTLKDGSKNIEVTEMQYKEMVTKVRQRHFPTNLGKTPAAIITEERAEKAEAAVFLAEARFFVQGNFTVAVLVLGETYFVGVTKRNKKDHSKPVFGKMTALSRAIQYALRYFLRDELKAQVAKPTAPVEPKSSNGVPRTFEDVARAVVYPNG